MLVATRYATHQEVEFKCFKLHSREWSLFIMRGILMDKGHFYYINDQYFIDFPDPMLMNNKEAVNGQAHDRPCFYAFKDTNTGLYWMIPISSQVSKLGKEKTFLIQNMCPITSSYIKNEYVNSMANVPVRIDGVFEHMLLDKAKRVLALQRKGVKLIFPDVLSIEAKLLKQAKG